jgi:hypothetical protein
VWDATKEREGADMGLDPGKEVLMQGGFREGVIAGAQGGDKNLGLFCLSGSGILDRNGLAGIIDEEFFPGPVFLP